MFIIETGQIKMSRDESLAGCGAGPRKTVKMPTSVWRELCRRCNILCASPGSWWHTILSDPEAVPLVEADGISVRLRGNLLLRVELRGQGVHCRVPPEYLLRVHPGSLAVLTEDQSSPVTSIASLEELTASYAQVKRRACNVTHRRRAVQDRLFLRHGAFLAVGAQFPPGNADLIAVHPDGLWTVFFLRQYADADLRLAGPGGVAHGLMQWRRWLGGDDAIAHMWELLARMQALHGPLHRRFKRFPETVRIFPRPRLLLVDFDHAQRLGGLDTLLGSLLELDPDLKREDIFAIGDPGNISLKLLFSGM